jgi:hypothetical protein
MPQRRNKINTADEYKKKRNRKPQRTISYENKIIYQV